MRLDIRDFILVAGIGFLYVGHLWIGSGLVSLALVWAWRRAARIERR